MVRTPSPWGNHQYAPQYGSQDYEVKDYNDIKRLLTLAYENQDEMAKDTAIMHPQLLNQALLDPNDKYRIWAERLLEERPLPQKTWKVEFTASFSRLGWNEAEARAEAEEFLNHLILVRDARITKIIPESGF